MVKQKTEQPASAPSGFYPLCPSLPVSEIGYFLGAVRGQPVETTAAIHAGLNVAGYALGQMSLEERQASVSEMGLAKVEYDPALTARLDEELSSLAPDDPGRQQAPAAAPDWKGLFKDIVTLLLSRFLGG